MPDVSRSSVPPISAGSLFGRTITVFLGTLPQFLFLSILILSPLSVLDYREFENPSLASDPTNQLLGVVAQIVLGNVLAGALVYGVFQKLAGERVSLGECIAQALRRFPLIAIVAVLYGLLIALGFVVFVIPGLLAMTIFAVAVPVAVVEGSSIGEAFRRSSELTFGNRWSVFGAIVLAFSFMLAMSFAAGLLLAVLELDDPLAQTLVVLVVKALVGVVNAILPAVMYHDLRALKDGVSVEDLRRVFE